MPNTVRFHRVLRATPERVYRAFLDPDAMVKWLPPNGFTGKVHHLDAKVGGTYRMSFTNFTTGNEPLLRRKLSRTGAPRTHPPHGQVRRPEPARRDAGDDHLEEGVLRDRAEHRAGRDPGRHSARGLLSRLAENRSPSSRSSSRPRYRVTRAGVAAEPGTLADEPMVSCKAAHFTRCISLALVHPTSRLHRPQSRGYHRKANS